MKSNDLDKWNISSNIPKTSELVVISFNLIVCVCWNQSQSTQLWICCENISGEKCRNCNNKNYYYLRNKFFWKYLTPKEVKDFTSKKKIYIKSTVETLLNILDTKRIIV